MKKVLCMIICTVMILSCVSCSQTESKTMPSTLPLSETTTQNATVPTLPQTTVEKGPIVLPNGFSAGYARETVNPNNGTAMAGYDAGDNRLSSKVEYDLWLTCTALSDGENVFLFFTTDTLFVSSTVVDTVTKRISGYLDGIEVPPENIVMNASHNHSGPSLHFPDATGVTRYLVKFYPAVYRVAEAAVRDLEQASIFAGRTETSGLNYVRRYVSIDGTKYIGNWPSYGQDPTKVRHETEADHELQVLRFDRKTKKDIVLCNWQCHPCSSGIGSESSTVISPDWVGPMRDAVEKEEGVLCAYLQGAAGNVVSSGKIQGEQKNSDYKKKGQKLAEAVSVALDSAKQVQSGKFYAHRDIYAATHSQAYMEKRGNKIAATQNLYVSALSIGEIAFATTPYEMHDTNGMQVKEGSPFKMTFMCAYTNGQYNYVAADHAYILGGYEVTGGRFVRGTGEAVVGLLLNRLDQLHAKY